MFVSATWNNRAIKQTASPFFAEEHRIQQHFLDFCLSAVFWSSPELNCEACEPRYSSTGCMYDGESPFTTAMWPSFPALTQHEKLDVLICFSAVIWCTRFPSCQGLIFGLLPFRKKLTQTSIISLSVTAFFLHYTAFHQLNIVDEWGLAGILPAIKGWRD